MKIHTSGHFDAAHRLDNYKGKCSNLHGHRWRVVVEAEVPSSEFKKGIVWDFTDLKKILDYFDHATILSKTEGNMRLINTLVELRSKVYILDVEPTAENFVKDIKNKLESKWSNIQFKVRVYESPTSWAEE